MLKIHLSHWRCCEIAKNHPDIYKLLLANAPDLGSIEDRLANKGWKDFTFYANNMEDVPEELLNGAEFSRIKTLSLYSDNGGISANDLKGAFQASQVHLPGNELLYITDVKVVTNACTDELRAELEECWKILAICPQVGQRRPDYVLGRIPRDFMRPERQKPLHPVIKPYGANRDSVGIPVGTSVAPGSITNFQQDIPF